MGESFQDLARSRRSIRRFVERPVPASLLTDLLQTAIWAPSAHNRQPWRFVLVTTDSVKRGLAQAMGNKLADDLAADGVDQLTIAKDVRRSHTRLTAAPALIVVCLSMKEMDRYPDARRSQSEWVMAIQSTAMAGQNLLLGAHDVGLGACWMCAPLFCPDVVRETLDLPTDWEPQGLVAVGYPAEAREKSRRPVESVYVTR